MLTANVSKIKKTALSNVTFILNVLLEDGIIFVWTSLFFRLKINLNFTKMSFFKTKLSANA